MDTAKKTFEINNNVKVRFWLSRNVDRMLT
jgi:hypothetical protein